MHDKFHFRIFNLKASFQGLNINIYRNTTFFFYGCETSCTVSLRKWGVIMYMLHQTFLDWSNQGREGGGDNSWASSREGDEKVIENFDRKNEVHFGDRGVNGSIML
jgi:hypothetical protein